MVAKGSHYSLVIHRDKGGTVRKPNDTWHVVVKVRTQVPRFFEIIGS
ncbi:hypothetical protein HOA92_07585 [archaeon]|jgi:hypothetical protein|nr:hypothetical protein [archaeon]MBT6762875.1 hypothetical protein [archaeon]